MVPEAYELCLENGEVAGVLAHTANGTLQVNAPAVILATGGYTTNFDLVDARLHTTMANNLSVSTPGHDGADILMAAAGARDVSAEHAGFMYYPVVKSTGFMGIPLTETGPLLWVNQDGEHFADEAVGMVQPGYRARAVTSQATSYGVANMGVLDLFQEMSTAMSPDGSGLIGALDALAAAGADNVFKGGALEELAANAPFDADTFLATAAAYNDACDAGFDPAYFKRADQLVKLEQGPFYAFRWDLHVTTSINGIHTSRNAEALRADETPVAGLYVVGMDGCELYDGFYTISTPGSANAFNVHSGRVAARHAVENHLG